MKLSVPLDVAGTQRYKTFKMQNVKNPGTPLYLPAARIFRYFLQKHIFSLPHTFFAFAKTASIITDTAVVLIKTVAGF